MKPRERARKKGPWLTKGKEERAKVYKGKEERAKVYKGKEERVSDGGGGGKEERANIDKRQGSNSK